MEKGEMGENATGRLATYYVAECMEFNRYGEYREDIQSAEEAVKYVDEVGSPNCKILLDTYHMNIEEDSFAGAIKLVGNRLGHFHVGESNRRPPCENGKMPWNEITNALKEIDYQGAIVMEPFIKMGGEVGRDIKVWRDISEGASESEMEQLLADAAMMLRKKMQR